MSTGVLRGELNQLAVSATGSGMTVNVATGRAWLKGHYVESDAIEARSIDGSDPTNPRIDRVVVRATYSQPGVPGAVALAVLKGTPAASPAAPALTQNTTTMWEIALAQVLIDAGAVVVAANKVTDGRGYARNIPRCHVTKSATQSVGASSSAAVTWNQETYDTDGMHDNVTNNTRITAKTAGLYLALVGLHGSTASTGSVRVSLRKGGSEVTSGESAFRNMSLQGIWSQVAYPVVLAVDEYCDVVCVNESGADSIDIQTDSFFALIRIGDA